MRLCLVYSAAMLPSAYAHSTRSRLARFLESEAAGGLLLMLAAALALAIVNAGGAAAYETLLTTPLATIAGRVVTLHALIDDGLMSVFFLLIGMEIKREVLLGELSTLSRALLPTAAAIGGMIVPALVFLAVNASAREYWHGWAIPSATDIAFALAVLSLFGKRVPFGLKIFLTAVAVIDDLGAVVVIAVFYGHGLAVSALACAAATMLSLFALGFIGTRRLWPFLALGFFLWLAVLASGIHATIAGVILGLLIPLKATGEETPLLSRLSHLLEPWVAYLILPLFAFANAGVAFGAMTWAEATSSLPLGIALGLILGKQVGIFGGAALMVSCRFAVLPALATWREMYGIALLGGVGFTMSLFIAGLAFNDAALGNALRFGILAGSLVSGTAGYVWLRVTLARRDDGQAEAVAASWPVR